MKFFLHRLKVYLAHTRSIHGSAAHAAMLCTYPEHSIKMFKTQHTEMPNAYFPQ